MNVETDTRRLLHMALVSFFHRLLGIGCFVRGGIIRGTQGIFQMPQLEKILVALLFKHLFHRNCFTVPLDALCIRYPRRLCILEARGWCGSRSPGCFSVPNGSRAPSRAPTCTRSPGIHRCSLADVHLEQVRLLTQQGASKAGKGTPHFASLLSAYPRLTAKGVSFACQTFCSAPRTFSFTLEGPLI